MAIPLVEENVDSGPCDKVAGSLGSFADLLMAGGVGLLMAGLREAALSRELDSGKKSE